MELQILEENQNPLFARKEISAAVEAEITPSRKATLEAFAKKFSVPEENIKIKGITGKFGSKKFLLKVNIYESREEKEAIELKKKKDKIPEKQEVESVKEEAKK